MLPVAYLQFIGIENSIQAIQSALEMLNFEEEIIQSISADIVRSGQALRSYDDEKIDRDETRSLPEQFSHTFIN